MYFKDLCSCWLGSWVPYLILILWSNYLDLGKILYILFSSIVNKRTKWFVKYYAGALTSSLPACLLIDGYFIWILLQSEASEEHSYYYKQWPSQPHNYISPWNCPHWKRLISLSHSPTQGSFCKFALFFGRVFFCVCVFFKLARDFAGVLNVQKKVE